MTVIPFPKPPEPQRPVDPLESALLSAWNNSPDVMDTYSDADSEDSSDSDWAW
ncbi:hypothetical protein [Streptomyces acidiscabies]|uniref:hypothetical protein n=1 Tax=Streptomyces acidiscabies TaxID=42234 RepID=UPI0009606F70|nr:hypothetical protein [Streptomyces acidiscabies]GAV45691.1 hypothetical protein Saa2_08683 [Streptomyces acidiscabies]